MVSLALWHFTVLVPDRFWGGIAGALVAALAGGGASGFLLPAPGLPMENPPGLGEAIWAIPGATLALVASYVYGAREIRRPPGDPTTPPGTPRAAGRARRGRTAAAAREAGG